MTLDNLPDEVVQGPMAALLKAVEQWLRGKLKDDVDKPEGRLVGVLGTGQPTPAAGVWFFSVHPMGENGQSGQADHVDNLLSIGVTLSVRVGTTPRDRMGRALMLADKGYLNAVDWLCGEKGIHGNYAILAAANEIIGQDGGGVDREETYEQQGFDQPLFFARAVHLEQGPAWWYSLGTGKPTAGLSCTMAFQGARFIREKVQ